MVTGWDWNGSYIIPFDSISGLSKFKYSFLKIKSFFKKYLNLHNDPPLLLTGSNLECVRIQTKATSLFPAQSIHLADSRSSPQKPGRFNLGPGWKIPAMGEVRRFAWRSG